MIYLNVSKEESFHKYQCPKLSLDLVYPLEKVFILLSWNIVKAGFLMGEIQVYENGLA